MNVDEYVAARYGRLLERAIELGAPDGLATEYVDQVLLDQRKAIRRADDPDPVVFAALERPCSSSQSPVAARGRSWAWDSSGSGSRSRSCSLRTR